MDLAQRIADATRYRDQTKGSYDAAKQQTQQKMTDYDSAFTQAPQYQTIYDQYKQKYANTAEIQQMKSTWETAKQTVDATKTMIDKLPESIGQQYGGTALTQAQRDKARQQQLGNLNKQFTQYNANYQVSFNDYNKRVNDAFNQALDVSNKQYDSYWNTVKVKFNAWKTSIANEDQWEKMYYQSRSALSNVQTEYKSWQIQQDTMRMQREFETWQNNFASMQRKQAMDNANYMTNWKNQRNQDEANKKTRWANAVSDFQAGRINASQLFATN